MGTAGAADGTAGAPDAMCSHGWAPVGICGVVGAEPPALTSEPFEELAPPRPPLRALSASEPFDEQRPRSSLPHAETSEVELPLADKAEAASSCVDTCRRICHGAAAAAAARAAAPSELLRAIGTTARTPSL